MRAAFETFLPELPLLLFFCVCIILLLCHKKQPTLYLVRSLTPRCSALELVRRNPRRAEGIVLPACETAQYLGRSRLP